VLGLGISLRYVYMVFILEFTIQTTWPNTTMESNTVLTTRYTMYGYANAEITKAVRNEDSGNIYYYGKASNPEYSFYIKTDSSDTNQWERIYQMAPWPLAFDVSHDETSLYSISLSTLRVRVFRQFSSDGLVSTGKDITGFYSDSKSKLGVSQDNIAIYISVYQRTTNIPALWKWDYSGAIFEWITYSSHNLAKALQGINQNELIFIIDDTNTAANLKIK
jgi:hypothetical protein